MSIGINTSPNAAMKCVQSYQEQIEIHCAWHSGISEKESEKLLIGKSPFTYLLRSGEKECPYFISFVREDGSIKHQFFALEFDRKGWLYRNGATGGPQEITSKDLDQLIPMMMHCDSFAGTPLKECLK
jgi:hypothetical protein